MHWSLHHLVGALHKCATDLRKDMKHAARFGNGAYLAEDLEKAGLSNGCMFKGALCQGMEKHGMTEANKVVGFEAWGRLASS